MNFLSGVLVSMIWILLVIPYLIVIPILSVFIKIEMYGTFIYGCILGTTLLLIICVSVISILFNMLMNKFEEAKKAKYLT
jgi:hypothetical protein